MADEISRKFQSLLEDLPNAPKEGSVVSLPEVLDRLASPTLSKSDWQEWARGLLGYDPEDTTPDSELQDKIANRLINYHTGLMAWQRWALFLLPDGSPNLTADQRRQELEKRLKANNR